MTPNIAAALLLLIASLLGIWISGARLIGYRLPNPFRSSQRPTLRAPSIPIEFETGEWETIP